MCMYIHILAIVSGVYLLTLNFEHPYVLKCVHTVHIYECVCLVGACKYIRTYVCVYSGTSLT